LSDQLFLTKENNISKEGPNINYNEGDIIVVVAEIPTDSYFLVDAPGNRVLKNEFSGGLPITSDFQSSNLEIRAHEKMLVAVLYPVNRDNGLDRLYIYLESVDRFSWTKDYKILEIARVEGPFSMPDEIKKWQETVNKIGI